MEYSNDRYDICFWNYYDSTLQDKSIVSKMYEMGCTMMMLPERKVDEGINSVKEILIECEKYNMECIAFDHFVTAAALKRLGEEKYIANLKKIEKEIGSYKMARFCFVADEPNSDEEYELCFKAASLMKKYFSKMQPFISHNHIGMRTKDDGIRVLKKYLQNRPVDFLLYNCYSQCMEEECDKEQGLYNYYNNLKTFTDFSKLYQISLWQSLVLVGHLCIKDPTQEQLRWQLNIGAAHGVKKFFWFHPLELGYSPDAKGHAIDNTNHKTLKYDMTRYESVRFMNDIACKLEGYKLDKVYHFMCSYGAYEEFYRSMDDIILEVSSQYNRPLVISKFLNGNKKLIMVVNESQEKNALATIKYLSNNKEVIESFYLTAGSAKIINIDESE